MITTMKNLFLIITIILTQTCISQNTSNKLRSGWYYVVDAPNQYKRVMETTTESYYINPNAIVTTQNFKKVEVSKNNSGDNMLVTWFDNKGTTDWAIATEAYTEKKWP